MKGRKRSSIFKVLLGFAAGIIVAICLLVPGKVGPTVLICGDERAQCQQLDQIGRQIENLGGKALEYVSSTRDYVQDRVTNITEQQ